MGELRGNLLEAGPWFDSDMHGQFSSAATFAVFGNAYWTSVGTKAWSAGQGVVDSISKGNEENACGRIQNMRYSRVCDSRRFFFVLCLGGF